MISKDLLYIQIFFLFSLIVNLFTEGLLFLKILLIFLLLLFIIKSKDSFVYNRQKYNFFSYGLLFFSILFLLTNYLTSSYFYTFLFCVLILYIYLFKVLFNSSYGEVISNKNGFIEVKVLDAFYKSKTLSFKHKTLLTGSIVVFSLTRFPLRKKPIAIIDVVPPYDPKPKKQSTKSSPVKQAAKKTPKKQIVKKTSNKKKLSRKKTSKTIKKKK